jgi:hypothetical protein
MPEYELISDMTSRIQDSDDNSRRSEEQNNSKTPFRKSYLNKSEPFKMHSGLSFVALCIDDLPALNGQNSQHLGFHSQHRMDAINPP